MIRVVLQVSIPITKGEVSERAMAFQGTLIFQAAGAAIESFLSQTNLEGTVNQSLVIIPLPPPATLQQQIAAATTYLSETCRLQNGAQISIEGKAIAIGPSVAIEMASCTPCIRV